MASERQGDHAQAARWLAKLPPRVAEKFGCRSLERVELELLRGEAVSLIVYDPIFLADPFEPRAP
jgi:hypothetical protein